MANLYSNSSPYAQTGLSSDGTYLDVLVDRAVPAYANDTVYTINAKYHLRPDLLAYDLFNDAGLWWVFAARNPNKLTDPLGSFTAGTIIYLPNASQLQDSLGL